MYLLYFMVVAIYKLQDIKSQSLGGEHPFSHQTTILSTAR
jgi:hypothetical protein